MNSWKIILATVVIFGAGVVTGGLLVNYVEHYHPRNIRHAEARPPLNGGTNQPPRLVDMLKPRQPDLLNTEFVKHLDEELQLTPEQRESIRQIIAKGQEQNHAIWTNNAAQMRAVMQDVRHRVRETLTAEQQKRFEELMRRVPRRPPGVTNAPPVLSAPTNAAP